MLNRMGWTQREK